MKCIKYKNKKIIIIIIELYRIYNVSKIIIILWKLKIFVWKLSNNFINVL